jgi:hypothetical protein
MPAPDADHVHLLLRSRNSKAPVKPVYRISETFVVRIGPSRSDFPQGNKYTSTRVWASDGFDWRIKLSWLKSHGEQEVEIVGCTRDEETARQLGVDRVLRHGVENGLDAQPQRDYGDCYYTLREWYRDEDGMDAYNAVHYWWSVLRVELKGWDASAGETFSLAATALADPDNERATYMRRAREEIVDASRHGKGVSGEEDGRSLVERHGRMGMEHVVHLTDDERVSETGVDRHQRAAWRSRRKMMRRIEHSRVRS